MRTIKKRTAPAELEDWRENRLEKNDPALYPFHYSAMRRDKVVLKKVEDGLFAEQGGICAYTGRMIGRNGKWGHAGFHMEHLTPQKCGAIGQDTDYLNIVACWPEPNQKEATEYGAVKKDDWPAPEEAALFVSPLDEGCSAKFRFVDRQDPAEDGKDSKHSIWMEPSNEGDDAAIETIKRINLNHRELRDLRWNAVFGALNPTGNAFLPLADLEKVATVMDRMAESLDAGADVKLDPFCFAVRQAIDRRIQKLQ